MKIVADENIPFSREAFGTLGEVALLPGDAITPDTIRDTTALIVRSVTKVDSRLLSGSTVQFVGTATTGVDHVDQEYLKANAILFASADGANAHSVAEYVLTALLISARDKRITLKGKSLGIIGVGNIGSLVAQKARAIGMEVILNDPPLQRKTGASRYRTFQEACDADFVTLHVPLIREGPDKTDPLFDASAIAQLNPATVVINTSRGAVIDNSALLQALTAKHLAPPILDVWENEPRIEWELLKQVKIGTPHIAGYGLDGKIKATEMIYEALCACLGGTPLWRPQSSLHQKIPITRIGTSGKDDIVLLSDLTRQVCHIAEDGNQLLKILNDPLEKRPAAFDHIRRHYPLRSAFCHTTVSVKNGTQDLNDQLLGLGFSLAQSSQ